jgi:hypothetical protein
MSDNYYFLAYGDPAGGQDEVDLEPAHGDRDCFWLCKLLCFFNIHRFDYPGGRCLCCGDLDGFFYKKK